MTFHEWLIGADPKGDRAYIARFYNAVLCGLLATATIILLLLQWGILLVRAFQ